MMIHCRRAAMGMALALTLSATMSGTASAGPVLERATASLAPQAGTHIRGRAVLILDTRTHVLRVVVTARRMVKSSTHPEHIHAGTCKRPGRVLFGLNVLHAGKGGTGRSVTVIKDVKSIAYRGWIVNVHRGPAMKGAGATPVACGPVVKAAPRRAGRGTKSATTTEASPWVQTDAATRTVDLKVIANYNSNGAGFNFDGYSGGKMTVTVPLGYKIVTHFKVSAKSELAHSFVVVAGKGRFSLAKPELAFPGASTPDPTTGTSPGSGNTVTFVAEKAGTYRFACLVPGHFDAGMWDYLVVKAGITRALVTVK